MQIFEGKLSAKDLKIGIVVSRFNSIVTSRLLDGALDCLNRHECQDKNISIYYVPGAWEIPLALKKLSKSGKFDGIIALGAVIRGETPHFDYVAAETSKGVALVSLEQEIPISFGILTTDTMEQAFDRAGGKAGNKGFDCALSLIETIQLLKITTVKE
ncbi:6,7-dimethyl-8-ribityllumazine synthase [Thermodesulfobium acidiphilum]|uniref:6,7-dimethyl-8-ribityllumazine synthase n=1 Tax=Thermodesulfobium acidiphilum TaxID=1794699 RepID=A0A2R4W219_THEAF|nr:6,7-dimethyl-8-ribityllumazine synthase [Thermodesulfobium acidiphilum]AWB10849.1 6,7-dimethyl-8-ribityllumazine synthase [Thermodesulfobium acidiphilum]PMP86300.1 MAG: 6,7-dimethyl-8-ribityllumazine synthase [Thermodesulfobium narugense]